MLEEEKLDERHTVVYLVMFMLAWSDGIVVKNELYMEGSGGGVMTSSILMFEVTRKTTKKKLRIIVVLVEFRNGRIPIAYKAISLVRRVCN